jgi:hypothetical protein
VASSIQASSPVTIRTSFHSRHNPQPPHNNSTLNILTLYTQLPQLIQTQTSQWYAHPAHAQAPRFQTAHSHSTTNPNHHPLHHQLTTSLAVLRLPHHPNHRQHIRAPRLSQTPRRPRDRHPPPRSRRPRRQSRQCPPVKHSCRWRRWQQLDHAEAVHRREPRSQGRPVRCHGAEHWVHY